ncbi:uncharacterized protein [Macrobrachium rosenbergii]|uniref:uncharacterized protein n=1 Tax=Macrobrachium rosenbergii TaxID=79674 RepID=UPI0034D5A920
MLSARLLGFVKSALRFKEDVTSYCWTDSTVALSWIKGDPSRWKPFVANRVMEIQSLTSPDCWYHCPGKDNPADLISRGVFAEHLVELQIFGWKAYPREFESLIQGRPLHRGSPLVKLDPFLDNDVRIKGRLEYSDLCYESKHPIIHPSTHVVKTLVRFQHVLLKHSGVSTLVSTLRNGYWIVRLRRIAKTVCRECVTCRRYDSKVCSQPVAPLPELRVKSAPPFSVTGLDFAGPLFCVDLPSKKFYILLFTCAVIRSVHLKLTDSLSMPDCLLAIRRFTARRGLPSVFYSDNAKTFVGGSQLLQQHYGPLAPQWKFIVPRAPWWGGWWERLVRSVKSALKKTMGVKCLSRCELETTLHVVEACINSRPLTFVGFVSKCNVKKGSVVLVKEDNVRIINRPVQKLHDLEISNALDTEAEGGVPCIVSELDDKSVPKPVYNHPDVNADDSDPYISQSRVEPISYSQRAFEIKLNKNVPYMSYSNEVKDFQLSQLELKQLKELPLVDEFFYYKEKVSPILSLFNLIIIMIMIVMFAILVKRVVISNIEKIITEIKGANEEVK